MKIPSQAHVFELYNSDGEPLLRTDRSVDVTTIARKSLERVPIVDEAVISLRQDENPRQVVGQFQIRVRVEPGEGKLVAFIRRTPVDD